MKFEQLQLLYAGLAALPLLLLAFVFILRERRLPMEYSGLDLLSKACMVLLLLMAVCGPYWEVSQDSHRLLALVDVSSSIDNRDGESMFRKVAQFAESGIDVDFLPFGGSAAPSEQLMRAGQSYESFRKSWSGLDSGATNLEALKQTLLLMKNSRVLLLSDGQFTQGDLQQVAGELSAQSNSIYPLVPEKIAPRKSGLEISKLHVPLVAPAQQSVEILVSVRNSAEETRSGVLEVMHDEKSLLKQSISLEPGRETLFKVLSDPSLEGMRAVTANIKPDQQGEPQDTRTVFLSGEEREKVLLLSGSAEDAQILKNLLVEQSYRLQNMEGEQARTFDLTQLAKYSVLVLNNIALKQLPAGAAEQIRRYVRDQGGGLIMVGGNRSFGLGGYIETPVEEILPVKLVVPQTQKKRLNVAVELVLDKSRSMAEGNKLEFAKEAASEVVRNLKDDDYIGVIGFDSAPFEVVRMGQVAKIKEQALSRIRILFPTGKTNLMPAMDDARRRLLEIPAGRKHMIVLTDGQLPDAGPFYIELVKQLRVVGITLSTVMLGPEADLGFLRSLADLGGGGYYQTNDARSLPRIFMQDIRVSTGEETLKEQREFMVRPGPDEIVSTQLENFPPLVGYVETERKENANLELVLYAEGKAEPLLASWSAGKGRSIAFTSDANGRWSNIWASWSKFYSFWSDLIDAARNRSEQSAGPLKFELRHVVENGALKVDLSLFDEQAAKNVSATLKTPEGKEVSLEFNRSARGRFKSVFERVKAGRYELRAQAAGRALTPIAFMVEPDQVGEHEGGGFDLVSLQYFASATGGKLNPLADDVKGVSQRKSERKDLAPLFFGLALIILCIEILWREVWRFSRAKWPQLNWLSKR